MAYRKDIQDFGALDFLNLKLLFYFKFVYLFMTCVDDGLSYKLVFGLFPSYMML